MLKKQILIAKEICPRCGQEFHCSKSGKCWCFEVSLSDETRDAITANYDTCLCPSCLQHFSEKEKGITNNFDITV